MAAPLLKGVNAAEHQLGPAFSHTRQCLSVSDGLPASNRLSKRDRRGGGRSLEAHACMCVFLFACDFLREYVPFPFIFDKKVVHAQAHPVSSRMGRLPFLINH